MPETTDSLGAPIPTDIPGSDAPVSSVVADPQPAPKKRGRPKGSKTKKTDVTHAPVASPVLNAPAPIAPAAAPIETDPTLAALASLTIEQKIDLIAEAGAGTMGLIASRAGPHWACSKEEFLPIARPLAILMPSLADPRVQLALGCAAVMGPRMIAHIEHVKRQRASTLTAGG